MAEDLQIVRKLSSVAAGQKCRSKKILLENIYSSMCSQMVRFDSSYNKLAEDLDIRPEILFSSAWSLPY